MKSAYAITIGLLFVGSGPVLADTNYPEDAPSVSTVTRDDVAIELRESQGLGSTFGSDGSFPPDSYAGPGMTRAQVIAELREAEHLGLKNFSEDEAPVATSEQQRLISEAGHRAAETQQALVVGNSSGK